MSHTFVYNLGEFTTIDDNCNLKITRGLFFDGTGNNHCNVEIRKKIKQVDEYDVNREDYEKKEVDESERRAYNDYGMERTYKTLWLKKVEAENSFHNDFSNVARLWRGVEQEEYGIYIEGIGTIDKQGDNNIGLGLGTGITGIRAKVRKGCKELATQIKNKVDEIKEDKKEINSIHITLDVFGFSRGAAAARNFIYEISNNKREADLKTSKNDYTTTHGNVYNSTYDCDKDGFVVKPAYLDNGKMPKLGYLGYFLLENKLNQEDLDKIKINIRFVGLYDTVASFGFKHSDDVEELQLNNLGNPTKVVHFTAMDEHRENFALSKILHNGVNFIEKTFPGVHSDIGGSYENDYKDRDKQELNPESITEKSYLFYQEAEKEAKKLVLEHWYEELGKDLKILQHSEFKTSHNNTYHYDNHYYIKGTRKNRKEYSYIFLHFMEYLFGEVLKDKKDETIIKTSRTEYSIVKFPLLVQAKNHLKEYLFDQIKEWKFIADQDLKQEDIENQRILRELRKKYLHRSAISGSIAHSPANNRKRKEY